MELRKKCKQLSVDNQRSHLDTSAGDRNIVQSAINILALLCSHSFLPICPLIVQTHWCAAMKLLSRLQFKCCTFLSSCNYPFVLITTKITALRECCIFEKKKNDLGLFLVWHVNIFSGVYSYCFRFV